MPKAFVLTKPPSNLPPPGGVTGGAPLGAPIVVLYTAAQVTVRERE